MPMRTVLRGDNRLPIYIQNKVGQGHLDAPRRRQTAAKSIKT